MLQRLRGASVALSDRTSLRKDSVLRVPPTLAATVALLLVVVACQDDHGDSSGSVHGHGGV